MMKLSTPISRSIFAKLNVHGRTLALAVAVRRGFVHLL